MVADSSRLVGYASINSCDALQRKPNGRVRRNTFLYGPPPNCKRKMRGTRLVCAHVYGLGWSERTPGQDGMRYALFPFTIAVLEDLGMCRVSRAPDWTVVPSHGSFAN